MYHYVRDIRGSAYPALKGLETEYFGRQLDYFSSHYSFISANTLCDHVRSGAPLPERPILLTFDDGLRDHFDVVFPLLRERNISGCFFPGAQPLYEHTVLDVHKLHFILAVGDVDEVVKDVLAGIDEARQLYGIPASADYLSGFRGYHRYDSVGVQFVKRMLQRELPEPLRACITDRLFAHFVTADAGSFAADLYMSIDQLQTLVDGGMAVGGHGYDHCWLDSAEPSRQREAVVRSKQMLRELGIGEENRYFCYPYGAYNDTLVEILREEKFSLGFTTRVALADMRTDEPLLLPRLDTNDFPQTRPEGRSRWTAMAY
jgi:peptidoglycan/xylan/chitin deacetylase (PgdA/CDA1 family)